MIACLPYNGIQAFFVSMVHGVAHRFLLKYSNVESSKTKVY